MVSIAYLGKVATNTIAIAADDAKEIGWFSVTNLPSLAFDHSAIIEAGLQKLL